MFQLLIDKELHELTPEDFVCLADKSKGYSCFDISVVVRDALKQRTQRVISATHFKHVQDPKLHSGKPNKWVPCTTGDPAAVKKSWSDIESDDLLEPGLNFADILKALDGVKPTVKEKEVKRYEDWAEEFGASPHLRASCYETDVSLTLDNNEA
jgi:vacuolar protein-sorting-associated protein 4